MKNFMFSILMVLMVMVSTVSATTFDIFVTTGNDWVTYRSWYYGGNYSYSEYAANPNQVSHSYEPGNGNAANSFLRFDLSSFTGSLSDITSVTFNYDVLSIWTEGRDDVGAFSGGGSVLASNGTGWKSFDVTSAWTSMTVIPAAIDYSIVYTGYSGFTFGSADGQNPAFLRIVTSGGDAPIPSPTPEPATMMLFGLGLIGLAKISRSKK